MVTDFREMNRASFHFVFQPIYTREGRLHAVECLSRIGKNSCLCYETFFHQAPGHLLMKIILWQLEEVKEHHHWFTENNIIVTLNLHERIFYRFLPVFASTYKSCMRYVHLEIDEKSTLFSQGVKGGCPGEDIVLWLDDYGSGDYRNVKALEDRFTYIKIDKHFFWWYYQRNQKQAFTDIISSLTKKQCRVVIEGIETPAQIRWLAGMDYYALQGKIWQEQALAHTARIRTTLPF